MRDRLRVELTDEDCDWIYSTFMLRIELLNEQLDLDGPDQSGADDMRVELCSSESIVNALRRAGYKTVAETRRGK